MEPVLYYIRDHLVGTHYFIYAFILLVLMFAIIGYLFKQKYGKLDIHLDVKSNLNQNKQNANVQSNSTNNTQPIQNTVAPKKVSN